MENDFLAEDWSPPQESVQAVLWTVLHRLPSDFEPPYGMRSRENDWGQDCSCGCRWYVPLEEGLGADWGVFTNSGSPGAGLLTWEHQGCYKFDGDGGAAEDPTGSPTSSRAWWGCSVLWWGVGQVL